MAKSTGVDTGVLIYLGFINTLLESLKHPENKKIVLDRFAELKDPIERKFKLTFQKNAEGLLEVEGDAQPQARKVFYDLLIAMVQSLEDKYGCDKTWANLRPKMHPLYAQHQTAIRDLELEVPLSKFELDFIIHGSLSKSWIYQMFFGMISGQSWSSGVILVTNKRLIISSGSQSTEINVGNILTVGREVYTDVKLKYSNRNIKMIDYKSSWGIAALMYEGSPQSIIEFNRTVSRARVEVRGLTSIEKKVLVVLDRRQALTSLVVHGDVDRKMLAKALARLREIDYITEDYKLTSYGLNALSEIQQEYRI